MDRLYRLVGGIALLAISASVAAFDLSELYPDYKAMLSANKAVGRGDMSGAVKQYLTAAQYGNKEAQKLIGLSYLDGSGVKQDNAQACAWLRLAASTQDARVVTAYNDLLAKINEDDQAKADKAYAKLQKKYGDKAALKKRKSWVRKEFRSMSGSGAKRPPPGMRVQVSLSPGRSHTVTMKEFQDALDAYVEEFESELESGS